MKTNYPQLFYAIAIMLFATACNKTNLQPVQPQKINFDWQFHLGDIENGQDPEMDAGAWRVLDLPHDWSIEGEYSPDHGTDWQSGFLPAGIGWYRKTLNWDPSWKGKEISIYFEGIYLNSDVWINGHHLGHRPNGYIGFEYDLTDYLKKGENIIAVKVDQSLPLTGRWYTGSGIYRHVWLNVRNPLHIPLWGVHFSSPEVSESQSVYMVDVTVKNQSSGPTGATVQLEWMDSLGNVVSKVSEKSPTIPANGEVVVTLKGSVEGARMWSPESPYLYTLKTSIVKENTVLDENILKTGFRNMDFNPEYGFKLNGGPTLFMGVCDHHTAGSVGAAVPDDVWEYRLRLLKEMGCNAIRTAHNPFSPSFYRLCDELGIMVMNEFLDGWEAEKADHDYGLYFEEWWERDGTDFIKRDRNHPSVIMWSIGNEVIKPTRETQEKLIALFHTLDPTRPVTQGGQDPTREVQGGEDLPSLLDLAGFNGYGEEVGVFEAYHEKNPGEVLIGTEVPHTYQTRGVYRTKTHWRVRDFPAMWEVRSPRAGQMEHLIDRIFPVPDLTKEEVFTDEVSTHFYKDGTSYPIENDSKWAGQLYYQSSYDNATVRAGARKTWQRVRDLPYVAGQFRWGSFDYLGETNNWPSRFGNFGVIDICGFPKDHFYLYKSLWTKEPMVHVLPHWTHPGKEGVKIPVVVYTNCDEVELFLNGKSLGTQKYVGEQLLWMVPYQASMIKAVAKKGGKVLAEMTHTTSGEPSAIKLSPDKLEIQANRSDVVHISLDIVDNSGVFCPYASNNVRFEVTGPAKIIGVDNGDPLDLSAYKTNVRRAFRGKVMLLLQAGNEPGEITVKAFSDGLEAAVLKMGSY